MGASIGVVGLGAMGSRIASRLATSGWEVHVYNRTPHRAPHLEGLGIKRHPSAGAVAAAADVLILVLWDAVAVQQVLRGEDGILAHVRSGAVIVDLSTIDIATSRALAEEAHDAGAGFLDCPVSGSLDRAGDGRLLLMAGGPDDALARAYDALTTLGKVMHVGRTNGSGLAMKLAINAQVAVQLVGWGEALAITGRFGIPDEMANEVMLASVVGSPMLVFRVPFLAEPPDEIWASAAQLRKDIEYAVAAGAADAPAIAIAQGLLGQVISDGLGDLEAVELIRAARQQSEWVRG